MPAWRSRGSPATGRRGRPGPADRPPPPSRTCPRRRRRRPADPGRCGAEGLADHPALEPPVRQVHTPRHNSGYHQTILSLGLTDSTTLSDAARSFTDAGPVRLPHTQQRDLVQVHHDLRGLEPGHALTGEPAPALVHVDLRAADHEGGHPLAEAPVGAAHHDCLADPGMLLQDPLDLGGGDVLAAPDDELLQAADDRQPAVGVERSEVAGGEPPPTDGLIGLGAPRRTRRRAPVPAPAPRRVPPAAAVGRWPGPPP